MDDLTAGADETADGALTIVSNRQPYGHQYTTAGIEPVRSHGGVITALNAVLQSAGGEWVAWGSESADFDPAVVSADGELEVPPADPSYTLKRVALEPDQVDDYYYGYSNQVLWPLFHAHLERIDVQPSFWDGYREVNERFADVLADRDASTVWFHDYHLFLAPRYLRNRLEGDVRTAHFVHIPWPPAELFEICPQGKQLLEGILANDHVGFHIERYRQNFLESVAETLPGADVDRSSGVVEFDDGDGSDDGRTATFVQPVGIDPDAVAARADSACADGRWEAIANAHELPEDVPVAVGVDRLDYTKGIDKRLDALEYVWERYPDARGTFAYLQKGVESRTRIPAYRRYRNRIRERVHEINERFGTNEWRPITYVESDLPYESVLALYRDADAAIVSSTKDGFNLVAQEFVAASRGTGGALVLSEFAGVADAFEDEALTVNPFDVEALGEAILEAVSMPNDEQERRTANLRARVEAATVDDWCATNLERLFADTE
ncbi:alpha,alpha-trehalose-phosphate synthase (UDP-forming) [Halopiger goleimassiliensis]|uniref:alpha,alpha-trehalose-phosphate synthase (UDP-forming) n=1 Tax=Halopiger goleimassiliensis TaxID=1293048 RepID=UPI000677FEAA|nr:trehalose-6-phosphate synthase [Halopiger goleimassiliensis]